MFERIVVGTDGSSTANKAVARAVELASRTGDTLHIVTAYRPTSMSKLEADRAVLPAEFRWALSADGEAQATLQAAALLAEKAGVKAETHALETDPAAAILGMAERLDAHLIVVGSKGIERRIRGSVPNTVTQDANCDVLVVHTV
ncbi:MAG TPA: universal stress protein [Acidimicrobiales bacterium]|nr:universal stress protein [Acidimicrobiales bacterium]